MAKRRMFSLSVIDTDIFLDMPSSAQALYFHLGMRADDDGFVSSPRKITVIANCSADDMKLLISKGFIIPFESGVCVIRDWQQNNYIQSDRYTETRYLSEKSSLTCDKGVYTRDIHDVSNLDPQVRVEIGKESSGKDREILSERKKQREKEVTTQKLRFSPPAIDEISNYCQERKNNIDPEKFMDYYQARGWKLSGGTAMKDWQATVRTWERRNKKSSEGFSYSDGSLEGSL